MSKDTKNGLELLPDDLLWAAGGHASDIVLTALADGQRGIVPGAVRAHVEQCSSCTTHLGNAVLLSLHVDRELAVRAEHDVVLATTPASTSLPPARRPLPRLAIALGLAVAVVGLLPSLLDEGDASTIRSFVTRDVPLLSKGLGTLAHRLDEPGSSAGLFLTYATAAVLVAMGIALVRILPKVAQKETPR